MTRGNITHNDFNVCGLLCYPQQHQIRLRRQIRLKFIHEYSFIRAFVIANRLKAVLQSSILTRLGIINRLAHCKTAIGLSACEPIPSLLLPCHTKSKSILFTLLHRPNSRASQAHHCDRKPKHLMQQKILSQVQIALNRNGGGKKQ